MTISADYLKMQKELHNDPNYGVAGQIFAPVVIDLAKYVNAQSISDYGAGKCSLQDALNNLGWQGFDYLPYDPAFPEYGEPKTADIVCCVDVLEHIEPLFLDTVLQNLRSVTHKFGFFTVSCVAAKKVLPDGRNAHLIQQPRTWWQPKFEELFEILQIEDTATGFWVVVAPKRLY